MGPQLVKIPAPPFFRLEIPPLAPASWQFQIVDQNNQVVKSQQGTAFSGTFLEWDGYDDALFKVLVGPAYSPVLTVTDAAGKKQNFFGDAIQMDALQYEQDGLLHIEFGNDRLYEKG